MGSSPETAKAGLDLLRRIADDTRELRLPPEKGRISLAQSVLPLSLVQGTRPYLETITHQLNGSYEQGWYDACAVMMRRLIETLIIELFEKRGTASKIQTQSGDFFQLKGLIGQVLVEPNLNLGRKTKRALSDVKELGDNSAHSRWYTTHRVDIDNIKNDFRVAVQELVGRSGLA